MGKKSDQEPAGPRPARHTKTAQCDECAISEAIVAGYEAHIDGLVLPDADDRHVLAAAIAAKADVIVTFNTRHFPSEALDPHGLEARHPGTFLAHQRQLNELPFLECARRCRGRLKAPRSPSRGYLGNLRKAGLAALSGELERTKDLLQSGTRRSRLCLSRAGQTGRSCT